MNLNYNPWKKRFLSLSSLSLSPQVITGQAASRLTGPAAQVKTVRARVCKPHVTYRRSTGQDKKKMKKIKINVHNMSALKNFGMLGCRIRPVVPAKSSCAG